MDNFENIFTVTEVTAHIKNILENKIGSLRVEGEVSNYVKATSGHIYFSLKDKTSLIRCVFFSGANKFSDFSFSNGDKVILEARLTVFERDGIYQLLVSKVLPAGRGALQIAFEELKNKLHKEGLFDNKNKKKIPLYPEKIGLITSETGAAVQDILNVLKRRFPVRVLLYPSIVQGKDAPASLIDGLRYFENSHDKPDLIIIGRGGGSYEDLFCFNDEALARKIFSFSIPVISAVGHEIDFTICDFVSDIRAATPSVAAELAVPDRQELLKSLLSKQSKLNMLTQNTINRYENRLLETEKKLNKKHPINQIYKYQQTIDYYSMKLSNYQRLFYKINERFINIKNKFCLYHPLKVIEKKSSLLYVKSKKLSYCFKQNFNHKDLLCHKKQYFYSMIKNLFESIHTNNIQTVISKKEKLKFVMKIKITDIKQNLKNKKTILKGMSPDVLLDKGYTLIEKTVSDKKKIVKNKQELSLHDVIILNFKDGKCSAEITE